MTEDTQTHDELADDVVLRPSPFHEGKTAVAFKSGVDVCWNCHTPVVHVSLFTDVPMGTTFVRLCNGIECAKAVMEERRMSTDGRSVQG